MAFWCDDAAQVLAEMKAGTWDGRDPSLEPGWVDRVNDEQLQRSRTMDPADARAEWLDGRRRMLGAFGALDDVSPQADEWFEETGPTHYAGHLPDLEDWVERLRSQA